MDPALLPMARVMVILGFRCGLRRGEALGLHWYDIAEAGPAPELRIQPSVGHQLKSRSARRRLLLLLLMEQIELDEILSLVRKQQQYGGAHPALFHGVTAQRLLTIIHEAMRAVTRDPSIKFHHLRHSFGTWTWMRFMVGESGKIPEQLGHLPETRAWLEGSVDFFRGMYDNQPVTTRRNDYLLAQLMGHSSASITLRHYVHGMDWMLDACLRATPNSQPSPSILAVASGLAERTAYNQAKHGTAAFFLPS